MARYVVFYLRSLIIYIGLVFSCGMNASYADDNIEFNTRFLDMKGEADFDLSRFSRKNYILPGKYNLQVSINNSTLSGDYDIFWYPSEEDPNDSFPCLSPDIVSLLGINPDLANKFTWIKEGTCLKPGQPEGIDIQVDLSQAILKITIPQAYLTYSDVNWDPPSRWDDGIPGVLFDYNLNASLQHQQNGEGDQHDVSGNGTVGANAGPWRLRADWQTNYQYQSGDDSYSSQNWEWSRYYAYRALSGLGAQLSLGEDYLQSDIFDSFNFAGASVRTDDQMLPPNLRGYAPEIAGVARTSAKVTISQQNRVLYEKQVPAGPFRIQDINQSVSGDLHVRIEEQDGSVQEYDVSTATIPFLTRVGQVRYKVAAGRPRSWDHSMSGSAFGAGEASWGIANGWSLYGGTISSAQDYQAYALGFGRDMAMLGALSFDVTHSRAMLPDNNVYGDSPVQGNSYRVSYSKDFDSLNGRLSFAGYRFSERNFMTMNEYLDAVEDEHTRAGHDKQMFTASYNQGFHSIGLNVFLTWTRRTYWDVNQQNNYNLMLSKHFNVGDFKNINVSLSGFRNEYDDEKDNGAYLSLSVPWGSHSSLTYSGSFDGNTNSNRVGYYSQVDENNNWQVNAGHSVQGSSADGYFRHNSNYGDVDVNAGYQEGEYSSAGISLQGGATLTAEGGAFHRSSVAGGTRLLVDTSGVSGVPVSSHGTAITSNAFGKAVISGVSDYYRSEFKVDVNNLPENAESFESVVQATLTQGAIGFRHFDVIGGQKAMAMLRMENGKQPPFGAQVKNARQQQVGLVDDDGSVYLAGVNAGEHMQVSWNGSIQCEFELPDPLPEDLFAGLLLPCRGTISTNVQK